MLGSGLKKGNRQASESLKLGHTLSQFRGWPPRANLGTPRAKLEDEKHMGPNKLPMYIYISTHIYISYLSVRYASGM